jgi:hypothetical protein
VTSEWLRRVQDRTGPGARERVRDGTAGGGELAGESECGCAVAGGVGGAVGVAGSGGSIGRGHWSAAGEPGRCDTGLCAMVGPGRYARPCGAGAAHARLR